MLSDVTWSSVTILLMISNACLLAFGCVTVARTSSNKSPHSVCDLESDQKEIAHLILSIASLDDCSVRLNDQSKSGNKDFRDRVENVGRKTSQQIKRHVDLIPKAGLQADEQFSFALTSGQ